MPVKSPNIATHLALGLAVMAAVASSFRTTAASMESSPSWQIEADPAFPEAATFAAAAGQPPEVVHHE